MKPFFFFLFLFYHFSNFPTNVSSITLIDLIVVARLLPHRKDEMCIVFKSSKVLIFFIVKLKFIAPSQLPITVLFHKLELPTQEVLRKAQFISVKEKSIT